MNPRAAALIKNTFLASRLDYLLRHIYAGDGTILCFHQVYPPDYRPELQKRINDSHFTPAGLETVLAWYARHGYSFVSMDDIPELLKNGGRRFVALTFDDGYRDNSIHALPVLRKFNAPMTMYASAGSPENTLVPWIFLLDRAIAEQEEISYGDDGGATVLSCHTMREKKSAFSRILDYALFHPAGQLHTLQRILASYAADIHRYCELLLTRDELREFGGEPLVTVGAHGVSHANLAAMPADDARREFEKSKRELETALGHPVRHFAYPYGGRAYTTEREFRFAAEAGFTTAASTRHAHLYPAHGVHLTALPRINIGPVVMRDPRLIRLYANGITAMKANRGGRIVVL